MKNGELAGYIDHTLLKPDATREAVAKLCAEAKRYRVRAVCVNPSWVQECASLLRGTGVAVCTVVGFPLGANATAVKVAETAQAVRDGAEEIDMVMNIGRFLGGDSGYVKEEIREVVKAAAPRIVKVIIETPLLKEPDRIALASRLAVECGAHFVKTCTGFAGSCDANHVRLMRETVGKVFGVKASGGIKTLADARAVIAAGATRIGTSSGAAILEELSRHH